ncbi:MAG: glycosyltransferase [Candidatus Nanoarchaeia archaeon]|jgi:GT2 family glycosyltransferase
MIRKFPKVSIVIAAHRANVHLRETVKKCLDLDYPSFDIIVVPTENFSFPHKKVRIIPVGNKSPAYKRGEGIRASNASIIAFIDDDAYPRSDWLKKAVNYLESGNIVGVGGPAITPPSDSVMQKAGGYVLESRLGSGSLAFRYTPKENRFVDDYQSCNLILKRAPLKMRLFNSKIWPGEDTELVNNLIKLSGKKVLYANDVVVFHHRRAMFKPHLKQIYGYGSHRGYFARVLPETSRRFTYFIPSLFFLFFLSGLALSFFNQIIMFLYLLVLAVYFFGLAYSSVRKNVLLSPLIFISIFLTHFVYGFAFIKGFIWGVKR